MSIDGLVYYLIPGGSSHGLLLIEVILCTRYVHMTTSESRRLKIHVQVTRLKLSL